MLVAHAASILKGIKGRNMPGFGLILKATLVISLH